MVLLAAHERAQLGQAHLVLLVLLLQLPRQALHLVLQLLGLRVHVALQVLLLLDLGLLVLEPHVLGLGLLERHLHLQLAADVRQLRRAGLELQEPALELRPLLAVELLLALQLGLVLLGQAVQSVPVLPLLGLQPGALPLAQSLLQLPQALLLHLPHLLAHRLPGELHLLPEVLRQFVSGGLGGFDLLGLLRHLTLQVLEGVLVGAPELVQRPLSVALQLGDVLLLLLHQALQLEHGPLHVAHDAAAGLQLLAERERLPLVVPLQALQLAPVALADLLLVAVAEAADDVAHLHRHGLQGEAEVPLLPGDQSAEVVQVVFHAPQVALGFLGRRPVAVGAQPERGDARVLPLQRGRVQDALAVDGVDDGRVERLHHHLGAAGVAYGVRRVQILLDHELVHRRHEVRLGALGEGVQVQGALLQDGVHVGVPDGFKVEGVGVYAVGGQVLQDRGDKQGLAGAGGRDAEGG